jgi:ABC-type nitrate/sulfonate/bicarbonate transport system substrate-binding protein
VGEPFDDSIYQQFRAKLRSAMEKPFVFVMINAALLLLAVGTVRAQPPAPVASAVQANLAPHPAPEQPLPFSHKTHVGMALPCQLCHTNPSPGKQMTFPATATCMSCHATTAIDRPAIKKLAAYADSKQPIPWVRVYKVLPGVTWTHREHLQAGVRCESCHGAVADLDAMAEMTAVTAMASCITCHQARSVSAACNVCHAWPKDASLVPAPMPLRVIAFPGGANLPLWVAEDKGLFAHEQLTVKLSPTPNSVVLVQSLINEEEDIALAAFDNVVAYQEGQGEVNLSTTPDLFAFMGFSHGTVRLVVNPDIKDYDGLRGKTLAVDAVATGYSLVLRKLLQSGGLKDGDYRLESVGSTAARAQALMENKFPGTILTTPLEITPESRGYRRLANAIDVLGPYQTIVGMTRRSWATGNHDALVGFIRASSEAIDWLFDSKNRTEAVAIYRRHLPNVSPDDAQRHVAALLAKREGFTRGGAFDSQGMVTVLRIRSEFGLPQKTLTDPARYIDESYQKAARRAVGAE